MTYRCGDVVWSMYHHHGRCCSINLLAILCSGVRAFGTYAVPVLICTLSMRGCVGSICEEFFLWLCGKQKYPIYCIYMCCCYAVAMLVQFCGYVAVMLLICCCCVAAMLLLCRCYALGMSFCFAAMLLLYWCYAAVLLLLVVKSFFVCHFAVAFHGIDFAKIVYGWDLFRETSILLIRVWLKSISFIYTACWYWPTFELYFLVNSFLFEICFWKMAFGVSLFVVIDFVKLGCVVSDVGCSILEIDLVKQSFLIWAIFFESPFCWNWLW